MKTMKILSIVLCLIIWGFEGWAQDKDWVGTWQYNAPQAEDQYQRGQIVFVMEGKELKAFINVNQNKIPGHHLQVSKDEASFSIVLEGEPIRISLKKENKKLSGEATYSEGKVSITAEKTV
jgi:hypothetical protein